MAGIDLRVFRGLNQTRDERLLEDGEATVAHNLLFDGSGALRAFDSPWLNVHNFGAVATPRTIYRYDDGSANGVWMRWSTDVNVVRGPVAGDTLRRIYSTGDGGPKMTHSGLGGTWRSIGVPAPVTAPTVSATLPETALAGTITSLTCASLKMIHEVKGREGRNSGNGQTNVVATTSPVALTTLPVGARVKVASIVDANNVTITGVGDANYSVPVDKLNYGLRWTSASGAALWRKGKKAYWNFLVPSGATLAIANHGLDVGDIIQITATSSVMSWTFATMATSPNTDQSSRTATITGNIVFTGDCNFIIDRDGQTIDPLVPNQNYEIETRTYVYTYVTDIGEESAPSPASDIVSVAIGDPVTVGGFAALPGGYTISYRRIYRTNTGDDGTELQFVVELPVATASYNDILDPAELGEVLPSESWSQPNANLKLIGALPNGALVGFFDKNLCFSEPGYPHAWPPEYQYPVEYDIVGGVVFGSSVFVGTKGNPYVFTGAHPRQMGPRRIRATEPCIGQNSPTNIGDRVVYVSPNGLIAVNEDSVENLTEPFIPPDVWRDYWFTDNVNIRGFYYEGGLDLAQRSDTGTSEVMSFFFKDSRPDLAREGRANYENFVDPADGSMYRIRDQVWSPAGVWVQRLVTTLREDEVTTGSGSSYWTGADTGNWVSKKFVLPKPMNMAWARITLEYSGHNATPDWSDLYLYVTFYSIMHNRVINSFVKGIAEFAEPTQDTLLFRLPEGFLAESYQVEVQLTDRIKVKRIQVGETIEDVL